MSIYRDDKKAWEYHRIAPDESVKIWRQCPMCGRYLRLGSVSINKYINDYRFEGFICQRHGEIIPYWLWSTDVVQNNLQSRR